MNQSALKREYKTPKPDIYEVLLIGGGNDGRRVPVTREFAESGRPLEVDYIPEHQRRVQDFDTMIADNREVVVTIEIYYLHLIFDKWFVGRFSGLSLQLMHKKLLTSYKPNNLTS